MWNGISLVSVICFFYLAAASILNAGMKELVWEDVSRNIRDTELQTVTVNPDNEDIVYISSFNAVYKTKDGGKKWDEVLSFRGTGKTINSIAITPSNTEIVYAGTDDGLLRSNNGGMKWTRIFRGVGELESSILSVVVSPVNPEIIFIGTKSGLYRTDNIGKSWEKARNLPSAAIVYSVVLDPSSPHTIYAATGKGLYKSLNSGIGWKRIYETHFSEENNLTSNEFETTEIDKVKIKPKIRSIAIDPADTGVIYAATSDGILITEDSGLTWSMLSSIGLISRDIRHLVIHSAESDRLYAATGRGVFRYSIVSDRWEELYKGIVSTDIRFLALAPVNRDSATTLWAATKRGVFKTIPVIEHTASKNSGIKAEEVQSMFIHEPSIEEIREATITYAEVSPEKIAKWRKAAGNKAWLPDLRVAYDQDIDWQSSSVFSSGKYVDDDITEGKDKGWSISLTWELGDLIWSTAQTSIDNRSKLMVQLRDDILNEVTRLYFERRRLQYEMLLSPPAEIQERIEKALRLQEITASIDALTGSYLSKRLAQVSGLNPLSSLPHQ